MRFSVNYGFLKPYFSIIFNYTLYIVFVQYLKINII